MNAPPQPPPINSSKRPRHWFLKLLLGGFVTVVAALSIITATAIILALWPDIDPPDDSDLQPHSASIDVTAGNAVDALIELKIHITEDEKQSLSDFRRRGETPDLATFYSEAILRNSAELDQLHEISRDPHWKFPHTYQIDEDTRYLNTLIEGSKLLKARTIQSLATGDHTAAIQDITTILRLGKNCEMGGGTIIQKIVAVSCSSIGQSGLAEMLDAHSLSIANLNKLDSQIPPLRLDSADFADAFRYEYQSFARLFENIDEGTQGLPRVIGSHGRIKAAFFQANRTKTMYANSMRVAIEDASRPRSESKFESEVIEPFMKQKQKLYPIFLSPNATGNVLHFIAMPVFNSLSDRHAHVQIANDLLRIRIAALRFREETGATPKELSDLVPTYLPALPIDPFDGQPIRFNADHGIIYSIGTDLIDQGGTWNPDEISSPPRYPSKTNKDKLPLEIREEPALFLLPDQLPRR